MTNYLRKIETTLEELLFASGKTILQEAMGYSLLHGGKRIRPLLYLKHLRLFQDLEEEDAHFACALEMIHAYSLIHDDLPSMDNDSLRRGKPTNHLVYGEALAILAGDALLNRAYEICFSLAEKNPIFLLLGKKLSLAAGDRGMIHGQVLDMTYQGKKMSPELLREMLLGKTGQLIALPIEAAAIRAQRSPEEISAWRSLGLDLGLAFQIKDDLLDQDSSATQLGKTPGKDKQAQKNSYVEVYGVEQANLDYEDLSQKILQDLSNLDKKNQLLDFYQALLERKY